MATTRIAVLDDADLCSNAFGHSVGVADYAYLLAL